MLYRISYTKFQANTYINISLCTFYQHLNLKQIFTNQLFNIYNVYQHMHAYQQNISWKHTSHYIHSLKHLSKTEPEMKYSMNHCIVYTVSPNMHHALISLISLVHQINICGREVTTSKIKILAIYMCMQDVQNK